MAPAFRIAQTFFPERAQENLEIDPDQLFQSRRDFQKIAQRFNAGIRQTTTQVPKGRLIRGSPSLRDSNSRALIFLIILDRNSRVWFHQDMETEELTKSPVYDGVHSPSYNDS